jgi:hypothetical protein
LGHQGNSEKECGGEIGNQKPKKQGELKREMRKRNEKN